MSEVAVNQVTSLTPDDSHTQKLVDFPRSDGSRIPYELYSSPAIYELEEERIFRGPTWSFVALEAELPNAYDFKSTFVGATPVVVTRNEDHSLSAWVNRCAHRGGTVCREARGNSRTHVCVYHQWSYGTRGDLRGVPFRRGLKDSPGMPADFDPKSHGLQQLRVESYRGLVFATFSDRASSLHDYVGPQMRSGLDRIFHKPIVYLGCTRQFLKSNWKLYIENVRDPYHASLLHAFFSTFNLARAGMRAEMVGDKHGLHTWLMGFHTEDTSGGAAYKDAKVSSFKEGLRLEDPSFLANVKEFDEIVNVHIQTIFPQLVVAQIQNSLAVRQLLPKGPGNFELIFFFFGYADDTPEMCAHRIKQANLVGPAGFVSMEDTLATELVQSATKGSSATAMADMGRDATDAQQTRSSISENWIRAFWRGYQELMEL
jgi:anthranilate 1,2-dioxygenase large subunit